MEMDEGDDLILLKQWRGDGGDGDRGAGDVLIRRHYPFAYRIASRLLLGDDDGAGEVCQGAFETLLHKRDEIESNVRGYLRRVVMLKVLAYRRRRQPEAGASSLQAAGGGAESAVAAREEIKLMVKALRRLPLDDQLLLAWVYGDDKTQREIAECLELGMAQCNSRISRARERLRKRLEELRSSPVRASTLGGFETWLASVHGRQEDDS